MTEGYIVINDDDPTLSTYFVVPSNKKLETLSPYKGSLHILCVLRDAGDPVNNKLIEYLKDFIDKGLSALPSTYREVWIEYKHWMQSEIRIPPKIRSSKDPFRAKKYHRFIDLNDPGYQMIKVCSVCNRPVRLGLWAKKHEARCTGMKIPDSKRSALLKEMGTTYEEYQSGKAVYRTDLVNLLPQD